MKIHTRTFIKIVTKKVFTEKQLQVYHSSLLQLIVNTIVVARPKVVRNIPLKEYYF